MRDRQQLIDRIRRNCDISDARHAGLFSICGLALRLRDLFKWERGLAVWEEGDPAEVLAWIGAREDHWETLAEAGYENLFLAGNEVDPFDTEAANRFLEPHGLYYGAGYARALKPTFFLAVVESRLKVDGLSGTLFPQLPLALEHLLRTGTWTGVEEAVDTGHAAAVGYAEAIMSVYRTAAAGGDLSRVEADVGRVLNLPS